MKILGFDIIDAAGIAIVSSYLTAVAFGAMSSDRTVTGLMFSVVRNIARSGLSKVDESLQNYIDEKDDEMLEKMRAVKKTGVHREVKSINKDESDKYEIFM